MSTDLLKKIFNIGPLLGLLLLITFFIPEKVLAQYTTLPHQFNTQIATGDKALIQGYFINNGWGQNYSGFKYFIPPGTLRVRFYFTTSAITHGGPQIFASSRFNAAPEATRQDFIDLEAKLPEITTSTYAAKMSDLLASKGYMGKRVISQTGEQIWIHSEFNANEVLPSNLTNAGGYVFVNFFNKTGGNTIPVRTIQGTFEVISSKYNDWRESMKFPSPDPTDPTVPEFDFSVSSKTNAELNQVYTADVQFSNFTEDKSISISGSDGQYRINSGDFTAEPGSVKSGQSVTVRLTSSPNYSQTVQTTLTIGGIAKNYQVTTKPDPDNSYQIIIFNPPHVSGVSKNIWVESSEVDVVMDASISISAGGEYKINNGSYTSKTGSVKSGDKVRIRVKSSDKDYTSVRAALHIGSASGTFTVSTALGTGNGGGGGILPDICTTWPSLPQCNGGNPPTPEPEPQKEIRLPTQLNQFILHNISSQGRSWPESLDMILELPSSLPESLAWDKAYMFGLLDIPGIGQFLAQKDIFGDVFLFGYNEGDPLIPFDLKEIDGHNNIPANPFSSLQVWEYTAKELADLGAVFYVAMVQGNNWDNWLGTAFRFTGGTGTNNNNPLPVMRSNESNDDFFRDDYLPVEAGYLEFNSTVFPSPDEAIHQPLRLDVKLPMGWEEMLGEDFEGINPEEIDWTVYALVLVENADDNRFLARSDIHRQPRLICFNNWTPVRPATWTRTLGAGSGYLDLFPSIDNLGLSAKDFAQLGVSFHVALVPQGNWNHFFGVHFRFQE